MAETIMCEGRAWTREELTAEVNAIIKEYDEKCLALGRAVVEAYSTLNQAETIRYRMQNLTDALIDIVALEAKYGGSEMDQIVR